MSNPGTESDNYDPNIIPAETAARKEREGSNFKQTTDESSNSIDTTAGQTVDQEGLANNYPVEPEMYIDEPGDLREEEEAKKAQREAELRAINQTDESGKLTTESDQRSKGVGQI
ncbi:MAG: hypothetical protein WBG38_12645 [Nodosilinea sp.]